MEIIFLVPFALFWGILQEAKFLARIHFPDDIELSRIHHVPKHDRWALDVERFDLVLAPHIRKEKKSKSVPSDRTTGSTVR